MARASRIRMRGGRIPRRAAKNWAGLGLGLGLACASGAGWLERPWNGHAPLSAVLEAEAGAPPPPGALRVRLAFGSDVDLDLHVTDPGGERISTEHRVARSGGRLVADLDCGSPGPRIETIVFPEAPAGRYRVGIDFPQRCDEQYEPARFVVVVEESGRREEHRGTLAPLHFRPNVLEFEATGPVR